MDENELDEALKYITPVDTTLLKPLLSEIYRDYRRGLSERIGADGVLEDGDAFDPDREEVRKLRLDGLDIPTIAQQTGMSKEQVVDYCHELGLPTEGDCRVYISVGNSSAKPQIPRCKNCGLPLPPGRRKFCCDRCHEEYKYKDRKTNSGKTAVCNVAGICVHEIDHFDDRVPASMNGESPAVVLMEEQLNEDTGEYESGFLFGSFFVPFSEVMRACEEGEEHETYKSDKELQIDD